MKKTIHTSHMLMAFILTALAACGGGGGGGGGTQPVQHTKAIITLASTGSLPAGTLIYGAQATVRLPAGVTAKASPSNMNPQVLVTDTGVVTASGQAVGAASVLATYATGSTAGTYKVDVYVAKIDGFPAGEFATVNCDIAAGSYPAAANFSVTDFAATDQNGAPITGLTAGYTAELQ